MILLWLLVWTHRLYDVISVVLLLYLLNTFCSAEDTFV